MKQISLNKSISIEFTKNKFLISISLLFIVPTPNIYINRKAFLVYILFVPLTLYLNIVLSAMMIKIIKYKQQNNF